MRYEEMNGEQLCAEEQDCLKRLEEYADPKRKLDLSRGKPSAEQLALSMGMMDTLTSQSILDSESRIDCRNYGCLEGIPEARRLLAGMLGTHPDCVLVGGNSSLTLMYALLSHGMTDGICGNTPWQKVEKRKFLCPVPGYDRHFAMTEHFGFELVSVPLLSDGPDMALVEELVRDETVKGIWCVPKYQNPTGIVFSDDTVRRFARLKPAAKDFRIFWDNAYCMHGFDGDTDPIPDLLTECEKAGNPDLVYEFCSTSKITFPGSGIAGVAASAANRGDILNFMKYATIGTDKLNQLRHARYFKNMIGLRNQMKQHGARLRPKFEAAYRVLDEELSPYDIARWTTPNGGYFFSLDTRGGCAKAVTAMCAEYGVKFTPAGATYPYGYDPHDSNLRLAPSFASEKEIEAAIRILALCIRIVTARKIRQERMKENGVCA